MKPSEKAKELVNEMMDMLYDDGSLSFKRILYPRAKQCALVAVDQIIDAIDWHKFEVPNDQLTYWHKVKQEIEKL